MIKRTIILFCALGLWLAACQPATPNQPSASALPAANTAQPAVKTQPAVSEATAAGPPVPPGCTVVSLASTPDATEQSLFPAVGEKDWTQGPDDASVTILEYGDFM